MSDFLSYTISYFSGGRYPGHFGNEENVGKKELGKEEKGWREKGYFVRFFVIIQFHNFSGEVSRFEAQLQ